jgi:UDP-glucose-4-epimerase GalE
LATLITGGAGYVGSHTAKFLAGQGADLVILDNLSTGHRWAAKWGRFVEGDLADTALLARLFRENPIDAVVHFAANAYVGESVGNPRKYFRNNLVNSLNLLDAMVDAGVGRIVFSSSCTTYGIPRQVPIAEDAPQTPLSPYGESKLFIERALAWYGKAYGLRWAALRYFNAAGADPDGELGEEHDPEPHLIPVVLQAALGERPHLEIFGVDYPTPDGTAIRDYVHVTDLARAHSLALAYLRTNENLVLNLGVGRGYSVREIVAEAEAVTGRKIPARTAPRREGDPPEMVADVAKADRVLGWKAANSDLRTILETAWRWHSARNALAKEACSRV